MIRRDLVGHRNFGTTADSAHGQALLERAELRVSRARRRVMDPGYPGGLRTR